MANKTANAVLVERRRLLGWGMTGFVGLAGLAVPKLADAAGLVPLPPHKPAANDAIDLSQLRDAVDDFDPPVPPSKPVASPEQAINLAEDLPGLDETIPLPLRKPGRPAGTVALVQTPEAGSPESPVEMRPVRLAGIPLPPHKPSDTGAVALAAASPAKPVARRMLGLTSPDAARQDPDALLQQAAFRAPSVIIKPTRETGLVRKLKLYAVNTGERFDGVYWRNGQYDDRMMTRLWVLLRDHRAQRVARIDPGVIDRVAKLQAEIGGGDTWHMICGYRCPYTNAARHRQSRGVASNSFHMKGMALDIRVPGHGVQQLYHAAMDQKAGGVGIYPRSDFVHMDTGPIRDWRGA